MALDRALLTYLEANLVSLEIDEIKKRLQPMMIGYSIQSPIFDPGAFVYRARRIDPNFNKTTGIKRKDLIYPTAMHARLGRLNRDGQPIFYGSMHKESVFFELRDLKAGDEIIVTFWQTTEKLFVNNIGYTEFAFKQLGAKRAIPQWGPPQSPGETTATITLPQISEEVRAIAMAKDKNREVKEAFSEYFMRKVNADESFRYKLTVAIAEMHLGTIKNHATQFGGILYPSVRMWANADNVALLPWFVDSHLEFRKAVHVRIKERTDAKLDIDYLDAAHEFDEDGKLKWLGRVQVWTLKPKQTAEFRVEVGMDNDGDYTRTEDGTPVHWRAKDALTGELMLRK